MNIFIYSLCLFFLDIHKFVPYHNVIFNGSLRESLPPKWRKGFHRRFGTTQKKQQRNPKKNRNHWLNKVPGSPCVILQVRSYVKFRFLNFNFLVVSSYISDKFFIQVIYHCFNLTDFSPLSCLTSLMSLTNPVLLQRKSQFLSLSYTPSSPRVNITSPFLYPVLQCGEPSSFTTTIRTYSFVLTVAFKH